MSREGAAPVRKRRKEQLRLDRSCSRAARIEQAPGMRGERHSFGLRRVVANANPPLALLEHGDQCPAIDGHRIERGLGQVARAKQAKQQVLGADELVAESLRLGTRLTDNALGGLGERNVRHG